MAGTAAFSSSRCSNRWEPERTPKLFIAYSDNTSLLSWLTTKRGVAALHGPMLEGRLAGGPGNYDEASFMRLLQGDGAGFEMRPEGLDTLKAGEAAGPLFGGTMTQLAASLGTPVRVRIPRPAPSCSSRT